MTTDFLTAYDFDFRMSNCCNSATQLLWTYNIENPAGDWRYSGRKLYAEPNTKRAAISHKVDIKCPDR